MLMSARLSGLDDLPVRRGMSRRADRRSEAAGQFPSARRGGGTWPARCTTPTVVRSRTAMTGARPRSPPQSTQSPGTAPGTGMRRQAVVLSLMTPMAASSAMMAEMVSGGRVAGQGDHVEAHRADRGHGLQLLQDEDARRPRRWQMRRPR